MSDWRCPQCGCPACHYNRSRMRRECDCCGWPVADPAQEEQLRRFDQDVDRAVRHLRAGNWYEAVGLLTPLMDQQPDEVRLYRLTLQAATENFENLAPRPLMIAPARKSWETLERLRGLDGQALQYARGGEPRQAGGVGGQRAGHPALFDVDGRLPAGGRAALCGRP